MRGVAEEKKRFLLRLDPTDYDALEKWSADELRSVNSQMEFILREALRKAGRRKTGVGEADDSQTA